MCRLKNASEVTIEKYTLHDAVEAYLKEVGTVSPKLDGRSVATDLGPGAFSQMKEGEYEFR
jgi:5'-nucleotidase